MLKKLRVKFIALNMATVAVVLAVVFTAICVIDYQQSVARVHETLDAALAHAGDAGGGPSSGTQPGAQVPADAARANGMPPEIGGKRESGSYARIAEAIDIAPHQILFLSDIVEELDAAREAGLQTVLLDRLSDYPLPRTGEATHGHARVENFQQITF